MRAITKIAGAELRSLFYSPIAWVIAIVFLVSCGVQFTAPLEAFAAQQQFSVRNIKDWPGFNFSMTHKLFVPALRFLFNNLFLFIPLLTMGAISREVHAGTMQLLSSSPVRTIDIVLGKYIGLAIYNAVLILPLLLIFVAGSFSIAFPEVLVFCTTLLGIYLLICTYTAIGLFISALTNYQVVAAILTILLFIFLQLAPMVGQEYDLIRDVTYFLDMSSRTNWLVTGLITSRDILYFLMGILLFVAFTYFKLKSKKESKPWYVHAARYIGTFMVVILLGFISGRAGNIAYLDITRDKINTVHPSVQTALKELKGEPLRVTLYTNLMDASYVNGVPSHRNPYIWGTWGQYLRFHPNIDFDFVYYYDLMEGDSSFYKEYPNKTLAQIAHRLTRLYQLPKSLFKSPDEIKKIVDLSGEGKRLVMQLEYKGRKTFLRTYDDVIFWPEQTHFVAAIRRLTRDTMPSILFTSGHYERNPYKLGEREYANHTLNSGSRIALMNLGVDVDTINLSQKEIPASTSILVVADPKSALTLEEQSKVRSYLDNGGDAIFYGEPGKQQMLNPLIENLGVSVDDGIIVSPNPDEMSHVVIDSLTDAAAHMATEPILYYYQQGKQALPQLGLSGSASISWKDNDSISVTKLFDVVHPKKAWIKRGYFVADSAAPVFSAASGDIMKESLTQGIAMTRKINNREQRIIITGDADLMSAIGKSGGALGNALYSWILKNEYPVYINYPLPIDNLLTISPSRSKQIQVLFSYVIPSIVFLLALIFLIRRKRK